MSLASRTASSASLTFITGITGPKVSSRITFIDGSASAITVGKGRTDIADDRFELELDGASDLKVTISGKLRGERATGKIEATVKPPGTTCKADLRWTGSLAKQRGD